MPGGVSTVRALGLPLAIALFASCDEPGLLPVHPPPLPPADAAAGARVVEERDGSPEPGRSVDAAWAAALDRPERASVARDAAAVAIRAGGPVPYQRYSPVDRYTLVDDGRSIVVSGRRQFVVFDASSLVPRGALRVRELARLRPVPKSSLFVAVDTAAHEVLYDTHPLALVHDFGGADVVIAPDAASIGVLEKPATFWLFDVASRRMRWRSIGNATLKEISFTDVGRVVVARDATGAWFTSDASTGQRLTTGSARSVSPAFSADGRLIAREVVTEEGETLLELAERASGKTIARTPACDGRFAMSFDAGGTRLAIGGTRNVCILHVPSLRLVGRVTLDFGSGDAEGRDRVTPEFVNDGRHVFAGRRDDLAALLEVSTMKRVASMGAHARSVASGVPRTNERALTRADTSS